MTTMRRNPLDYMPCMVVCIVKYSIYTIQHTSKLTFFVRSQFGRMLKRERSACACVICVGYSPAHSICSIKSIFNNKLTHSLCQTKRFITHSFRVFYSFTMYKLVQIPNIYYNFRFNLLAIGTICLK